MRRRTYCLRAQIGEGDLVIKFSFKHFEQIFLLEARPLTPISRDAQCYQIMAFLSNLWCQSVFLTAELGFSFFVSVKSVSIIHLLSRSVLRFFSFPILPMPLKNLLYCSFRRTSGERDFRGIFNLLSLSGCHHVCKMTIWDQSTI